MSPKGSRVSRATPSNSSNATPSSARSPRISNWRSPQSRKSRITPTAASISGEQKTFHFPLEEKIKEEVVDEAACCICLEEDLNDDLALDPADELPITVPLSLDLPCACQENVAGQPAKVHEACLRQWISVCARRQQAQAQQSNDDTPATVTCPLCRAPLPEAIARSFELPARARAALKQCPQLYALKALCAADGVLKNIVKVEEKRAPTLPQNEAAGPRVLSLYVQGFANAPSGKEMPLLVARAPRVLGNARLATKFAIFYCAPDGKETMVASVARNALGTRWTIECATNGSVRAQVEYETNRFHNRPRTMRVDIAENNSSNAQACGDNCQKPSKFHSRAPDYSPQIGGYCLDFYGRARLASVRNFQLVDPEAGPLVRGDEETRALLLFGRWSKDEFRLDVKAPFSIVDAFGIAVSSFATKLACI